MRKVLIGLFCLAFALAGLNSLSHSGPSISVSGGSANISDSGTTATTFQLDSDASGPTLKNNSGVLEVRNAADDDYALLKSSGFISRSATERGDIKGYELTGNGDNYKGFRFPTAITATMQGDWPDTDPSGGQVMEWATPSAGYSAISWVTLMKADTSATLTNKTFDANGTGNVLKGYGYIQLGGQAFKLIGSGVTTPGTTNTAFAYGLPKFVNSTDKATNYIDYVFQVPADLDTTVAITGQLTFYLGGADTGDHEYLVSMCNPAASAAAACSPGDEIALGFTADGSGADGDVEQTAETTLTGWAAALTPGRMMLVRLARDGDNGNDTSTVDSYPLVLTLKYGFTN